MSKIKRNVKLFISSAVATSIILFTITLAYLSLCKTYEAIRKNGFNDNRKVVIISKTYVKVFDYECHF